MALSFGKTWWGEKWLGSLKNIDNSNRLPRGATYARNGSVRSISIDDNKIDASVKGSQPRPYKVVVEVPAFTNSEISGLIDAISKRPVLISKLLNRELDPDLLTVAEQLGLKVFPKQWKDFKMHCSCPDSAVPCKHLAAVIYKVSAEIDNNPFLVFELHHMNLIKELESRGIFIDTKSIEIPSLTELHIAPKTKVPPLDDENNAYAKLPFAKLHPIGEPLSALLADLPAFYHGSGNFKEKYLTQLIAIVKSAQRILGEKVQPSYFFCSYELKKKVVPRTELVVTVDEEYQPSVLLDEVKRPLKDLFNAFSSIDPSKMLDYQPNTAVLNSAFHLAIHLLANGAVVPQIVHLTNKKYLLRWLPAMLSKEVRELVQQLDSMLPSGVLMMDAKAKLTEVNKDRAANLMSVFLTEMIEIVHCSGRQSSKADGDHFLSLFFQKQAYAFTKPGEEALAGGVMAWTQRYFITSGKYKPQLVVEEQSNERFDIKVSIEEKGSVGLPVGVDAVFKQAKYNKQRFEMLQSLTLLSQFVKGLDGYINSEGRDALVMSNDLFTNFLLNVIPVIQLLDISVLLPKSLQTLLRPKVSVGLKKKDHGGRSYVRLDELLDFNWQVAIGNTIMDEKEFKKLLRKSESLIKYKTNYIYVSKEELEKLHKHFSGSQQLSSFEMLRAALSGEYQGAPIAMTEDVKKMIDEFSNFTEIPLPKAIKATLRPYQLRGYSWMYRNAKVGFGSVLADDMGLGKTLQVITALAKFKEEGLLDNKKALVVAPTGLLTNWQAEMEKFAPSLKVSLFHGSSRELAAVNEYDVLLTSYGVARSDAAKLKKAKWHCLVIDEAQNIKNTDTAQTKAVKSIGADNFIAMSGTPVENRLSELWSIMDYANRGILGNASEFKKNYSKPIEQMNDQGVATQLKSVTAPFMMRRMKTDKSIISDLPDKIEINSYSVLTKDQAALYSKTLRKAMDEIEGINATDSKSLFARQGLVLQMILALKQICNHPTQFLKNKNLDATLSGKMELLFDKLDGIVESNEKVLVFTQFTEMGQMLSHFLAERYGDEPLFYHGGCSVKQRKEMVDRFQGNRADKIFILSLKAAGTGLNLTAANHVIHYDLWWNPAVEAQATDRAYRIGQKKNVMVHRLITKNTFEEKIDEMIQAKKQLADMTVATGESWVGNLSNKELKNLFALEG